VTAAGSVAKVGTGAPQSAFNVPIGPYRRFAWVRTDLGELKQIKNEVGGTVNDVVLAAVAGALGRFLKGRGEATHELELRAMVPISVRAADEHGALGNRVSSFMAPLPVWRDDPLDRLRRVSETMGDLKQSKQAVGAAMLTQLGDFAPPTIMGQAARLTSRQRFFNLVVTNVPGPQFPLYLLGRELQAIFPMVPLAENQAICFGIMSYNGQVNFGLTADYDAMPDVDALADDLRYSIDELATAAEPKRPKKRAKKTPKAKPAKGQAKKGTNGKRAATKA
jgi:diacylglycerol O-acyltransferase / wax synthase